jgi:hypothetical protein
MSQNRLGLRCIHCKDSRVHVTAAAFFLWKRLHGEVGADAEAEGGDDGVNSSDVVITAEV